MVGGDGTDRQIFLPMSLSRTSNHPHHPDSKDISVHLAKSRNKLTVLRVKPMRLVIRAALSSPNLIVQVLMLGREMTLFSSRDSLHSVLFAQYTAEQSAGFFGVHMGPYDMSPLACNHSMQPESWCIDR